MKVVLTIALLCATVPPAAFAAPHGRPLSSSRIRIVLPAGWHGSASPNETCDPARLLIASSGPIGFRGGGRLSRPAGRQVLLLVMEDRLAQDRPSGNLRRPRHFSVDWNRLHRLDGGSACGLPDGPAYLRYFKTHGRYIGFIVFAGARTSRATRAKLVAVMDSLRVSP